MLVLLQLVLLLVVLLLLFALLLVVLLLLLLFTGNVDVLPVCRLLVGVLGHCWGGW